MKKFIEVIAVFLALPLKVKLLMPMFFLTPVVGVLVKLSILPMWVLWIEVAVVMLLVLLSPKTKDYDKAKKQVDDMQTFMYM